VQRTNPGRLGRAATGERLAGFIYGTIVVLAVIVAGERAHSDDAARIAALVLVTSSVFWVAHVYAHALAHSVVEDQRLSMVALRRIARREASLMEAALPPVVALLLGGFGLISTEVAVWASLGLGLVVLAAQGVTFARVERLGWLGTLGIVAANLLLGVGLVGLKLVVSH
jgi:hypothetical protein